MKILAFLRTLPCRMPWPVYYWSHRWEVIETYDSVTRKLRCTTCEQYFAMSDRYKAILPWDDEYEQIIRSIYGVPRSKR